MGNAFNYLKQQAETIKVRETSLDYIDEKVLDLVMYLQSSKFHDDTTVQVADVLRRLESVRSELGNYYCDRRGIDRPLPHSFNLHLKRSNNGN